jgi:hypothetical protein
MTMTAKVFGASEYQWFSLNHLLTQDSARHNNINTLKYMKLNVLTMN